MCLLGFALTTLQSHAGWTSLWSTKNLANANLEQPIQQSCEKGAGMRPESGLGNPSQYVSRFQIGGNYTRARIKITHQMPFNGNLGGAQGMYEFRPKNNFYAALGATWKQGSPHNGHAHRKLLYIDAQERVGYTYSTHCKNWTTSLFTGLGYRHLGHKLERHGTHMKFEYNELYVPLGVVSDYRFSSWFAGGMNFIWMPQVYPTVKIDPLKGARWILEKKIDNLLVELPLTFTMLHSRRLAVIVKPFYEYWQDGKTTAKNASGLKLDLPGNTYNFWGGELNLAYSF